MGGILLIDAEQPFADNLAGSLKGRGFQVKLLDDGKDGLDFAKDSRPDLIVLCVELPKMSGYSICNKLKKDNDLKGIPLIITSKEATPETFAQHKKLKTRAEDYLIKPFSEGELIEKIGALIPLPSGGASADAAIGGGDSALDALESLGADLDLGPSSGGGESSVQLKDDDLASFDVGDASASLGLSPDDDALLASLDDLGKSDSSAAAGGGLDDLELPSVKDDGFDDAFDAIAPEAPPARPEPPRPEPPRAEPPRMAEPARATPPRTETPRPTVAPTSSADLQQLSLLRRESSDLKAKVAELESKLRAADDNLKTARESHVPSPAGGSSAREVLTLKEQLRAKDKEMDALRDAELEKDKSIVELQEQLERAQAEAQTKADMANRKDAELSGLKAKVDALTEERDQLEEQVNTRLAAAENEREELRGQLEGVRAESQKFKADLDRAKQVEERLKMDVDRAKVDATDERKAKQAAETRLKELETEARTQEERAVKAYQRLKTEETVREKAKKAVEIAFTLLNGDVDTGGKSADLDIDQLDAE
ncbi:MAG: response regulator [Deltaproteobacteria bacterium]|nr:response regulator [Deltaproteobacteria bacterium]